jgi:membrane fusion protein, multidrug efflux system
MSARLLAGLMALALAASAAGCGRASSGAQPPAGPAAVGVTVATVQAQPVDRMLRITGTLIADEEAEVAAEVAGRVTATPVERGSRVAEGTPLISLAQVEAQAGATDAEANVAQLEARLALQPGEPFDVEQVPEVATAKASRDLAEADFNRIKSLLDQKVVSQAEFDQRRNQAEMARNQYRTARNAAQQQYRMLEGARARASLASKALSDTIVRAPFAGLVVERKVSVGDFVTRGTKVVTVVKVSPLRAELTVPEQSAGLVSPGRLVRLQVDAFPGRYFDGQVRFVSPAYRADQRALTVEAIIPNTDNALKPGMFVSAEVALPSSEASLVVPAGAVQTVAGISHVFVIRGGKAEERMITPGVTVGAITEVIKGLAAGEVVAVGGVSSLTDGGPVRVDGTAAVSPAAASVPARQQ